MVINMLSCTFSIYFLVATLCVFMCEGNSNIKICDEKDERALLKLKVGFTDYFGILLSWKLEVDCCNWNGISCNHLTGHVTKLHVPSNVTRYLEGNIDSSLCDLQHLTHLNLGGFNDFRGSKIPKCIGSLNQLRELNLSYVGLVGTIPNELRNLSSLQTLVLGNNYGLIAYELEWISNLSSLRHLDLSHTNLSQAIDWQSSLSKISSLLELKLDDCALPQVNPKSFLRNNYSTSLTSLTLADNYLDTSVLHWVSNISKTLIEIDLSGNSFQHIPTGAFSNMNSLKSLDLSDTSLKHVASDAFTNSTSLERLDLFDNNLDNDVVKAISNSCRLRELGLSFNKLSGPVSDWILQLYFTQHSMERLNLRDNPFHSGPFPDFSNFSSLVSLGLSNNGLNGPIPQSLGYLMYLSKLDISRNNLSGPIPQSLGYLMYLSELDISYNNLSGPIPQSLEYLPNISRMDMSYDKLSGPFPKLHEASLLETLRVSDNKLNGVVNEGHLSSFSNLRELDVSNNFLSFNISPKWVPPFKLDTFFARSCNFSNGFPLWLKHQRKLSNLDISSGSISDSIPEWIWVLPGMDYVNISHNKIHGELSGSLQSIYEDGVWDFSFNNLSGPIPHFSPEIAILLLSNNRFSGSISSLCSTLHSHLLYLDMSNNLLSGKLPHCWRQFLKLEVLILANNNFSGAIPSSLGYLEVIKTIHLNNNSFSGKIPTLMNSPYLKFIDYGQNNLNGKLLTWIGHYLPNLIVLRLQANRFHGNIPISLCKLSLLQILDLSQNNITGTIPLCLNNLSALSNLTFSKGTISYGIISSDSWESSFIENAMLNWKGEDVKYDKNLGLMTAIDLSNNHLTGEIPSSITSLVALASLNISRNNMTGFIPKNMGQMKMLESLDLSSNSLSGGIPISFSSLSFLSFMNVSFNNLSGEIPKTTQLQTFNATSYMGNSGLCGQPLTKGCSKYDDFDQNHKSNPNIDENEGDELINFGFYVSMIFGFFVGFWGVCGTLILKSSWRAAYYRFFANMYDLVYVSLMIFKAIMKRRFQD